MESIIIRYKDNGLVHYDGKDYVESLTRTSGIKVKRRPLPGR